MKACGIIAEYNPFHNGHLYQLEQAKRLTQSDVIIAIMSGNYTQRGEPAILDKWTRAQLALDAGVDLVVELPFAFAVEPADRFAQGGILMAAELQCDFLAFGTEDDQLDYQVLGTKLASLPDVKTDFVDYQQTYATQLNQLYQKELGISLDQPNQLLALSYAKANADLGSPLTLVPVLRQGAGHHVDTLKSEYASGSAIRKAVQTGLFARLNDQVPDVTLCALKLANQVNWDLLFPFLKYRIQSSSLVELAQIYQMSEGLEYRFVQTIKTATTFEEFIFALKTKRYTYTRLMRVCLYCLLNLTEKRIQKAYQLPYIRPLGFNAVGRQYLNKVKKSLSIPLVTKIDAKIGNGSGIAALDVQVDQLIQQLTGVSQNFGRAVIQLNL